VSFLFVSRGFGFVTFVDSTVAQKVVNMQHSLRKQVLNVAYADPKQGRGGGSHQSSNNPQFNSPMDYGPPPTSVARSQGPPRYYAASQPPAHQGYGMSGYDDFRQGPVHDSPGPMVRSIGM